MFKFSQMQINKISILLAGLFFSLFVRAQTLDQYPNKDASVLYNTRPGYEYNMNANYSTMTSIYVENGTNSSYAHQWIGYFGFDLSQIPACATINSATLYLYGDGTHRNATLSGGGFLSNESYLQRTTSLWAYNTVTYNNQPTYTTANSVTLASSTSFSQNYTVNIGALIQDMLNNPSQGAGLRFKLATDSKYCRMSFYSSDYSDISKRPRLIITYTYQGTTITSNPIPVTTCVGSSFGLSVGASGKAPLSYEWKKDGSVVGTNSSSYTVSSASTTNAGSYSVTVTGSCGIVTSNSAVVSVNIIPSRPGSISTSGNNCPGSSMSFNISAVQGASTYTWSVPTGWTINSGQGSTAITATLGAAGQNGNVTVTAGNACGISAAQTLAVSVSSLSTAPTGINITNNNTCAGTLKTLTVNGGSLGNNGVWQWFTGSCGGTSAGTGSSISLNPAVGTSTVYYVRASGTCNTTACASNTVTVSPGAPTTPSSITPGTPSPVCPGSSELTYSISSVANASTYTWSAPTGWTITSGQGSTAITVTSGAAGQNGEIRVTAGNSCGTSEARTLAVNVSSGAPAIPEKIIGAEIVCPGVTGQVYSISSVSSATTYIWEVPSGWTITAGQGTTTLTVTTGGTGQNGEIRVVSSNSCGNSATKSLGVIVSSGIQAIKGPITGSTLVCAGLQEQNYSIAPVDNVNTYTWSVPDGWSISSGQGTASITVTAGLTGQNGNVSVFSGNTCGNSNPISLAVEMGGSPPDPAGAITGNSIIYENQTKVSYKVGLIANATSYKWSLPSGASIIAGENTNSILVTFTNVSVGNITVSGVNGCGTGLSSVLSVKPIPVAPSGLTINQNSSNLTLSWTDNSQIEDGFKIEQKKSGSEEFVVIGIVGPNANLFNPINLAVGESYSFRVYAYNYNGNSELSNEFLYEPTNTFKINSVFIGEGYNYTLNGTSVETQQASSGGIITATFNNTVNNTIVIHVNNTDLNEESEIRFSLDKLSGISNLEVSQGEGFVKLPQDYYQIKPNNELVLLPGKKTKTINSKLTVNLKDGVLFTPGSSPFDLLRIMGLEYVGQFNIKIYDLSNVLVFETNDKANFWDGKDRNTSLFVPKGVYKYVIQYDNLSMSGQFIISYH
jgi:hypothetical protein